MRDPRVSKLAKLLVDYSIEIKPKELVAITALTPASPLVEELFRECLQRGSYPYYLSRGFPPYTLGLENLWEIYLKHANSDQLQHTDIIWEKVVNEFNVWIAILSLSNTQAIANIDPSLVTLRRRAHNQLMNTVFKRTASGEMRRVLTLFPTPGYAQYAGMSLDEFENYVFSATFVDQEDPAAEWKKTGSFQQELVSWLSGKEKMVIKGEDVDLEMSIAGRKWISCSGKVNVPDGEIFTGPVEESVSGWIRFAYPDYITGREIPGIELQFTNGRVENATAKGNQDSLQEMLNTDPGARYVGEFGIGTNYRMNRFIKEMLFDEKIGGTIHLALGHGYIGSGSKNESAIHWDLLHDMKKGGQIIVDDTLFYDSGEFKL